jgi:hypothetical protein
VRQILLCCEALPAFQVAVFASLPGVRPQKRWRQLMQSVQVGMNLMHVDT